MRKSFNPFKNTVDAIRKNGEKMNQRIKLPQEKEIERVELENCFGEWLSRSDVTVVDYKVILYVHSGGFCLGLANNHRDFGLALVKRTKIKIFAVEYRVAPENPYPAANDDVLTAYHYLLENGYSSENIIIGGDSAGASLALQTLLSLKEKKEPLPKAAFLLSMMGGELTGFGGESYESKEKRDPLNSREIIKKYSDYYLADQQLSSPIMGGLEGLPPLFIQLGSEEVVLSDSTTLAERAKDAGVSVELHIWEGMWHLFQGFYSVVPEAKRALKELCSFIEKQQN
jgi:epsilon-lactone hydrolase